MGELKNSVATEKWCWVALCSKVVSAAKDTHNENFEMVGQIMQC